MSCWVRAFVGGCLCWCWSGCAPDDEVVPLVEISAGQEGRSLARPERVARSIDAKLATDAVNGEAHSLVSDMVARSVRQGEVLSAADRRHVLAVLAAGRPVAMSQADWHERINDWLNWLRSDASADTGPLIDALVSLVDKSSDPVVRVYALQHLGLLRAGGRAGVDADRIDTLFMRLAAAPGDPASGTALMMLHEAVDTVPITALPLILSKDAPTQVRVTALHVAVEQGDVRCLDAARGLAGDTSQPTVLRKAAVFAIGCLGDDSDNKLLEHLLLEQEMIEPAASAAIQRIYQRAAP